MPVWQNPLRRFPKSVIPYFAKGHVCVSLCRKEAEKQDGADDEKFNGVNAGTSTKKYEDDKLYACEN